MMKKPIALFFLLLMASAATLMAQEATTVKQASTENVSSVSNGPKAEWDTKTLDLGVVQYMVAKDAEFTLTNTGNEPLLITYAKASCGCTNLKYSQEPILPGSSTKLSVTYNGSGNGNFTKSITVQTNADAGRTSLMIKGNVIREEETKTAGGEQK
jgi:hypothetical protein